MTFTLFFAASSANTATARTEAFQQSGLRSCLDRDHLGAL